jgi:protein involved in polysaccharide export with SLBB domain
LKAKTATITINGAVQEPGTYVLSGGDRVLDAIRKANGGTLPSINDCNYREIACKNRDSIKKIDMFNYLLKNDFSGNPYLYPGDNISLLYATKRVLLNTLAKSGVSGWIPIKENETLGEFLSFHRLDCSVDTTIIYYQSLGEKANRFIKAISWSDAGTVVLQDKDVITIPGKENYSPVYMVTIGGEVARPGTYSIIRNNTTAEEIISNAGGPTARANIDAAVIIRFRKVEDGQQSRGKEKTLQTTDIRPEMRAGLEKMANMSDFSIMELNRVGTKTLLQEDDRIYFPPKETVVYISGNVKLPGAYPYVAGKDLKYYIQGAGGYTSKASKTNTFGIRYYERVSQQTDLREIKEGDIIIVPESQQGKTLSTVILPILSIVFGTVGTALTIISIAMQ